MTDLSPPSSGYPADSQFHVAPSLLDFAAPDGSEHLQTENKTSGDQPNPEDATSVEADPTPSSDLRRKHELHQKGSLPARFSKYFADVEARIQELVTTITKEKTSFFETADVLAKNKRECNPDTFKDIYRAAGIGRKSADNYLRVANAKHLRKPEFLPYLPTTAGPLIDLANSDKWTEEKIKKCINAKVMRSDVSRARLKKWWFEEQGTSRNVAKQEKPYTSGAVYEARCVLYYHTSLPISHRTSIEEMLLTWRPAAPADVNTEGKPYLVLRKLSAKESKRHTHDRFCDQAGYILREDGSPMSPTQVRTTDETVYAEPWNDSLGVRPGDIV